jgi:1-phosphofructokinase
MMTTAPVVATVTLNAAIDQTAHIPDFRAGEVNRVAGEQSDAGGKGVNVASFLSQCGHKVAVTGLLGRDNIELFTKLFADRDIDDYFVRVDGQTRVNIKVTDAVRNRVTDINFPGLEGSQAMLDSVVSTVESLAAAGTKWFVLSGSLPTGVPVDAYRTLVARLTARGKYVVVDTSGPPLSAAISVVPDVIKPNIDELQELMGTELSTETDIVGAARSLVEKGIGLVAVSRGAQGAIFVTKAEAVSAIPPKVDVKSTVGAGDAMVAGIVDGAIHGLPLDQLAARATAFSLGALGEIGSNLPPSDTIDDFASRVTVQSVCA